MAEPQPPTIPPTDPDADEAPPTAPTTAEDRKAAAALSSLDVRDEDSASAQKNDVDTKALGDAMSRLEMAGKGKAEEKGKSTGEGNGVVRKKVKVDQGDVVLLVEELELSKVKATELLRAHEGDAVKAMRAFVVALG